MSNMNKLANSKNPFQGDAKKVLTICSAGLLRSPTAAKVLSETYGFNCRAAGIVDEYALIPVTDVLIYWANEVVFMEYEHYNKFQQVWKDNSIAKKVLEGDNYQILNIPDSFPWNDKNLVERILEAYDEKK